MLSLSCHIISLCSIPSPDTSVSAPQFSSLPDIAMIREKRERQEHRRNGILYCAVLWFRVGILSETIAAFYVSIYSSYLFVFSIRLAGLSWLACEVASRVTLLAADNQPRW